jgi:hypothetical protein
MSSWALKYEESVEIVLTNMIISSWTLKRPQFHVFVNVKEITRMFWK